MPNRYFYSKLGYFDGVNNKLILDKVLVVSNNGKIENIVKLDEIDNSRLEIFDGLIVPGFVNAHCHLELSHLKGIIPSGTGLLEFMKKVVTLRGYSEDIILQNICQADTEMYDNGIVAVGDISNGINTCITKNESKIVYHTFIEGFDFYQSSDAKETSNKLMNIFTQFDCLKNNSKSIVPHAPYSVSPELFDFITKSNNIHGSKIVSIHNQETPAEDELFRTGTGAFHDFASFFGKTYQSFIPTGNYSIDYSISHLNPEFNVLLVHNTLSNSESIDKVEKWSNNAYWVSCPNANLYIENKLPDYKSWIKNEVKICVGTDSYASNWQLSIIEELKTIKKYLSDIDLGTLLVWACSNGAKSLDKFETLGSLEIGKTPGINLLKNVKILDDGDFNISESTVMKLI